MPLPARRRGPVDGQDPAEVEVEQDVSVTIGDDGALVAHTRFAKCECDPELSYRPGDAPSEYRCGCKNELIVGPGAEGLLSPAGNGTIGSRLVTAPDGAQVEVAWRLRPLKPPRVRPEPAA